MQCVSFLATNSQPEKNFKATAARSSGAKFDFGVRSYPSLDWSPTCMHNNKLYIFGDYNGPGVDSKY